MSKMKIMLVDDDRITSLSLSEVLDKEGFEVVCVDNGETALQILEKQVYDLIVLDLVMPGINGIEALNRIEAISPNTPVIILTGYGTLESAIGALRSRAWDYLLKPVLPVDLVESVRKALNRKKYPRNHVYRLNDETFFDFNKRIIQKGSKFIHLTATEGRLFETLLQQRGQVISHHDLVMAVQGYDVMGQEAAKILRPVMCRLRRKLTVVQEGKDWIKNIRSSGYIFDLETSE